MLEKFTDEEIEQIKFELKEYEERENGKVKPSRTKEYKDSVNKIFKDRPYHYPSYPNCTDIADRCLSSIDIIVSFTLDCTKIEDKESYEYKAHGYGYEHNLHTQRMNRVPNDVADEYYEMFDEIIELIKSHLKPYKRFLEEVEE